MGAVYVDQARADRIMHSAQVPMPSRYRAEICWGTHYLAVLRYPPILRLKHRYGNGSSQLRAIFASVFDK